MTQQDIFDSSRQTYLKAIDLVNLMSRQVKEVLPDFTDVAARCQLDIITQYVLLKVALADGKFLPVEGDFIDKITDSFDIIKLVDAPDGMNWRWFSENIEFEKIVPFVSLVEKEATKHMEFFAQVFALLDLADTDMDYLKLLTVSILDIALGFAHIDGDLDDREVETVKQTVADCLMTPWLAMMEDAKKKNN